MLISVIIVIQVIRNTRGKGVFYVLGFAITDLFCLLNYHLASGVYPVPVSECSLQTKKKKKKKNYHLALFKFVLAKFAVITEFHFIFEHSISQFVFLL